MPKVHHAGAYPLGGRAVDRKGRSRSRSLTPKVRKTTPAPVLLLRLLQAGSSPRFPAYFFRMGDRWETINVTIRAILLTSANFR